MQNHKSAPRRLRALFLAAAATVSTPQFSFGQFTTWTGPVDGSWFQAARWSNGVPNGPTADARITAVGAAYTVHLNQSAQVGSLQINSPDVTFHHSAGTLSGVVSISAGTYRWSGGSLQGLAVGQNAYLDNGVNGGTLTLRGLLANAGSASLQDDVGGQGTLILSGGQLSNLATGSMTLGLRHIGGAGTILNAGQMYLRGGAVNPAVGTLTIDASVEFSNSGTLDIQVNRDQLDDELGLVDWAFPGRFFNSGTLIFRGGYTRDGARPVVENTGTMIVDGDLQIERLVSSGVVRLGGPLQLGVVNVISETVLNGGSTLVAAGSEAGGYRSRFFPGPVLSVAGNSFIGTDPTTVVNDVLNPKYFGSMLVASVGTELRVVDNVTCSILTTIEGEGSLIKKGNGTLVLGGGEAYYKLLGEIVAEEGTILLDRLAPFPYGSPSLASLRIEEQGTVKFARENQLRIGSQVIINGGTLETAGFFTRAGNFLLNSGNITGSGQAIDIAGGLGINAIGGLSSIEPQLTFAGTRQVYVGADAQLDTNSVFGNGTISLKKSGPGIWALNGILQIGGTLTLGQQNTGNSGGRIVMHDYFGGSGSVIELKDGTLATSPNWVSNFIETQFIRVSESSAGTVVSRFDVATDTFLNIAAPIIGAGMSKVGDGTLLLLGNVSNAAVGTFLTSAGTTEFRKDDGAYAWTGAGVRVAGGTLLFTRDNQLSPTTTLDVAGGVAVLEPGNRQSVQALSVSQPGQLFLRDHASIAVGSPGNLAAFNVDLGRIESDGSTSAGTLTLNGNGVMDNGRIDLPVIDLQSGSIELADRFLFSDGAQLFARDEIRIGPAFRLNIGSSGFGGAHLLEGPISNSGEIVLNNSTSQLHLRSTSFSQYLPGSSITGPGRVIVSGGVHEFAAESFQPSGSVWLTSDYVSFADQIAPSEIIINGGGALSGFVNADFAIAPDAPLQTAGAVVRFGTPMLRPVLAFGIATLSLPREQLRGGALLAGDFTIQSNSTNPSQIVVIGEGGTVESIRSNAASLRFTGTAAGAGAFASLETNTGTIVLANGSIPFAPESGRLTNSGTLAVEQTSILLTPGALTLDNTGTVTVRSRELQITGPIQQLSGSSLTGGRWIAAGDETGAARLGFGGRAVTEIGSNAQVTVSGAGSRFDSAGSVNLLNGKFTLDRGANLLSTSASPLAIGGTLSIGSSSEIELLRPLTLNSRGRIELAADDDDPARLTLRDNVTYNAGIAAAIASTGEGNPGLLDLGGLSRTFTVADGTDPVDLQVSARIVNGGLTKQGAGVLELGSANGYTGATQILGGTLRASNSAAIPETSVVQIGAGTLAVAGVGATVAGLENVGSSTSGQVLLQGGSIQINPQQPRTFGGRIVGTGDVNKTGPAAQTLSGTLGFVGSLTVNAGELQLANAFNSFAGSISLAGGTLSISNDLQLGNNSNSIRMSGGALRTTSTVTSARAITLTGGGTFDIQQNASTFSGALGGAGALTKVGAGTLVLSPSSATLSGTLSVANSGGSVRILGGSNRLANVSHYRADVGGAIVMDKSVFNSFSEGLPNPDVTLSGGTLSIVGAPSAGTTENFGKLDLNTGASTISMLPGSSGSLTVNFGTFGTRQVGATLNVLADNLGTLVTSANRLTFGAGLPAGDIGGWFTITSPTTGAVSFAEQTLGGIRPLAVASTTTSFASGQHVRLTASATSPAANPFAIKTLTLEPGSGSLTVTIPAANSLQLTQGGLIKSGAGSATIAGGTLTSGTTELNVTVSAGTLNISAPIGTISGGIGSFTLTKRGFGTLSITGSTASNYGGASVISGFLDLNKTGGNAVPGDLIVSGGTVRSLQNEQIINTGCLILNAGTFQLGGATISETIRCLQNNNGFLDFNGGTIIVNETAELNGGTTIVASTLTLPTGTSELIVRSASNTVGASGVINASGGLKMLGSASPQITLNGGVLNLSGNVQVGGGTTSDQLGSGTAKIASGASTGTIDLAGAARTFNIGSFTGDSDLEISARIRNGGIVKNGDGVMRLLNPNSHALGTIVNFGELEGTNNSFGSGSVAVNDSALLSMRSNAPSGGFANPLRIGSVGNPANDAAIVIGPDTVAGIPGTFAMTDAQLAGTLSVSGIGTLSVTSTTLLDGVTLSSFVTTEIAGVISGGSNQLTYFPAPTAPQPAGPDGRTRKGTQTAAGTLIISAQGSTANSFAGITQNSGTIVLNRPSGVVAVPGGLTISSGLTKLSNDEQIADNALVSLNGPAAVLDLGNRSETIGLLNLNGGTVIVGSGTLILTGSLARGGANSAVTASGATPATIDGGRIQLQGFAPSLEIADGPAGEDLRLNSAISAINGFTKSGAGNLVLAGNSSGSLGIGGVVTVAAGTLTAASSLSLGSATVALSGGVLAAQVPITNRITVSGVGQLNVPFGQTANFTQPVSSSGSISLIKTGGGRLVLSSSNSFVGAIQIDAGTLSYSADNNLGEAANAIFLGDGVLQYTGGTPITLSRGLTSLNGGIDVATPGVTYTIPNAIRGQVAGTNESGNFTKYGPGILILQTIPAYNGTTAARGGNLVLTASGAIVNGTLVGGRAWAVYDNAALTLAGGPITENIGDVTLSGANSSFSQINSLSINSGAFTITDGRAFAASGLWTNSGKVLIGANSVLRTSSGLVNTGSLTLNRNGLVRIGGNFDVATGTLDLNGAMIIDYTGASPAAAVRAQLAAGYNGAQWNGTSHIQSSLAGIQNATIGYAEASQLNLSTFFGESVDLTTLLLRYTVPGDANLDGVTGIGDFAVIAANFNRPAVWTGGDFNYDGVANISDFALLAGNFNRSLAGEMPASIPLEVRLNAQTMPRAIVVPEPPAVVLPCIFALTSWQHAVRRRRMRQSRARQALQVEHSGIAALSVGTSIPLLKSPVSGRRSAVIAGAAVGQAVAISTSMMS